MDLFVMWTQILDVQNQIYKDHMERSLTPVFFVNTNLWKKEAPNLDWSGAEEAS